MATNSTGRSAATGRFVVKPDKQSVTVITEKVSHGKVGSYKVRTVHSGRFRSATQAASSSLKEVRKK